MKIVVHGAEWDLKDGLEPVGSSDGFWYDITNGGYIRPKEIIANPKQLAAIEDAIRILREFEASLKAADLLNEF